MAPKKQRQHASPVQNPLRLAFLFAVAFSSGIAQQTTLPDSLSAVLPDSLRATRSKSRFIPFIGNLKRAADSTSLLHSTQFIQSDAASVSDLLRRVPGVFIRDLGQPGQPSQLNVNGLDDRATALLIDGRPLRDPVTGRYDLNDIPVEFIDEIELQNNPASLFAAPNSAGGTINFVSHQYDNVRPMTKLRFFQGPFEHLLTDAIFAQNISRGINAMFGLQRLVTDGRFPNSKYDSWSYRARVRYNVAERINLWASDFYNRSTTGLNGGIDPSNSPSFFDQLTAVVRDSSSVQTATRHDLTFGLIGKLLPDSTALSRVIAYYSIIDREYSTGATQFTPPRFSDLQSSSVWGARAEQQIDLTAIDVEVGAEYEQRIIQKGYFLKSLKETYSAAKGRAIFRPLDWLTTEGSARFENLRDDHALSWSIRLQANVTDWFSVWGELSRNFRYPTVQELYWNDSTLVRGGMPAKETHLLTELGFRLKTGPLSVLVGGFRRRIDDAVVFTQIGTPAAPLSLVIISSPQVDVEGITTNLSLQLWRLTLTGHFAYTDYRDHNRSTQPFPRFASYGEFSYRDTFGNDVVELQLAARLKAISHHNGLLFIPVQLSFAQQNSILTPGYTSFDFYAVAKMGDAHLTLVWENPVNVNSMMVPYYPMLGRNVKLGVNWIFTD